MASPRRIALVTAAAIALAAAMAGPASASFSSGAKFNASFVNTGATVLTIGSSSISCTSWTITGTILGSSVSAPVTGTNWSGCTATITGMQWAATITDADGAWTLTITASLGMGNYSLSITLGGPITITTSICTISIASQTRSGPIWNPSHSLGLSLTGIAFTSSGVFCPLPASGSTASWAGSFSEPTLTLT